MSLIVITCLLFHSALPVYSDAFPLLRHGRRGPLARPTSSTMERRNATPLPPPLQSSSESSSSFDGISPSDGRGPIFVRGGGATPSAMEKTKAFLSKHFFLLGMVAAVSLAKLLPELGRDGSLLRPELFIGKYGVALIFLLSGLSLKLADLTDAAANVSLNGMIQVSTFGVWPFLIGLPLTKGIGAWMPHLLPQPLLDGLLILTCLPTTINMAIILTSASGGNVATALCNTVISNLAGIFLTPALLLRFFGTGIELPFVELVSKLSSKVLLPVAVGQALRATPVKDMYSKHIALFKRLQEMVLLGIVWNAFSNAFTKGIGLEFGNFVALLALLPVLHLSALFTFFAIFRSQFVNTTPSEAVAATFCASHKTLAFGLPLIKTVFEGNPNLASYCAPLMMIHPLQLVLGSLVIPYFVKSTEKNTE